MVQSWDQVTFVYWRFEPDTVQCALPTGLTVETFDGSAWVGLVPFFLRVSPSGARSHVAVEIGEPFAPDELTDLDHFLTARSALFSAPRSGLRHAPVSHVPWPLHRAQLVRLDDELLGAAGLPQPAGDPLVHHSPAVAARIGWPSRIGR